MKYFIQTTRFYPNSYKDFGFERLENGLYLLREDKSIWKERKLLDIGYGRENGLCRLPIPSFNELINLTFVDLDKDINEKMYNFWGSLSVLIDDYCCELINYIKIKHNEDSSFSKKYSHVIEYINAELNIAEELINKLLDKNMASCCRLWKCIHKELIK